MRDLEIHIDIALAARALPLKGCHAYERLLKPFLAPPSPSMYKELGIGPALERDAPEDTKAFKAHVYGRRVLDDVLVTAVFELLLHAPEARVVMERHAKDLQAHTFVVKSDADLRLYRRMLEQYLAEKERFKLVLAGWKAPGMPVAPVKLVLAR